ncbi:MAG: NUDIX domain-containing protein [Clostridia bacterium]|nr:NUDIX domain-containing protein [Clostridia bacterium]
MTYEKSCGAVVFRDEFDENGNSQKYVLMIRHTAKSRHSFPKGHVEPGESEIMTAQREVFEETGIHIRIVDKFRQSVHYSPKPSVKKTVVYFVATTDKVDTFPRENEIAAAEWINVEVAEKLLAHANDKKVFASALEYISEKVSLKGC